MSIFDINREIQNFLTINNITPEVHSKTDLGKTRDLFNQMTKIITDSQNPKIIVGMTEFIDRITPKIEKAEPRCLYISKQIKGIIYAKLKSLNSAPELKKAVDIEYSNIKISTKLGLDTWESTGDITTAKVRIIECFKNNSTNLDLSCLDLSSIPSDVFENLPQLTILNLSSNELTTLTLPASMPQLTLLDLSFNKLTILTFPDSMPQLTLLDLFRNRLTTLTLPDSMPLLTKLHIAENQLTTLTLPASMPQLTSLDLFFNKLTTLTLPASMPELIYLNLSTDSQPLHFPLLCLN